jgi:hypothetical protein
VQLLQTGPEVPIHPIQLELYRQASPEQKLRTVARLNAALIALKEAQLKTDFPDETPEERRKSLRRWWLTARD